MFVNLLDNMRTLITQVSHRVWYDKPEEIYYFLSKNTWGNNLLHLKSLISNSKSSVIILTMDFYSGLLRNSKDQFYPIIKDNEKCKIYLDKFSSKKSNMIGQIKILKKEKINFRLVGHDTRIFLHAKIILIDGSHAFYGSPNVTSYGHCKNYEVLKYTRKPEKVEFIKGIIDDFAKSLPA